jgi:endoglucanase
MRICPGMIVGIGVLINTVTLFGQTDSIPPDHSGMSSLTSVEFAKEMVPGWNVGNSLEAIGGETAWGNPKISQRLIDSVKAAGFRSIRIPVAWSKFTGDTSKYTIDTTWLGRVGEVIDYVLKDSMYAIINEHWDGGWQQPTYADSTYVNRRLAAMWKQIGIHFRDYGDHLLFAGMNEVAVTNDYGLPTTERAAVQNSFCQTFVNTVRSTGGRNVYRYLVVQGYRTDINATVGYFAVPTDVTANRLMVEVHYYDPYNFTINTGTGYTTQWGVNAAIKTDTWANEPYADGQFQKMKTNFIDKGYAVILGEYGVVARLNLGSDSLNAVCAGYRLYYMQYITHSMFTHGLVPVYWDNGYTGNNSMGIFNRSTGAQAYPDIVKAIVQAVITNVNNISPTPTKFKLMQNYPNPFNPQTTISYFLPRESTVTLRVYNLIGREVATLVENERKAAGNYEVSFGGTNLSSGVYFYRLQTDGFVDTKAMMLIK